MTVYVGTYTSGDSRGIYRLAFDTAAGALSAAAQPAAVTVHPSFLALHPGGRFLYAVNETGETRDERTGAVSAFAVDARSGVLTLLNHQPSGGGAPCHLWITRGGRHLLVANYASGTVAVLPIGTDGRLGAATALVEHQGRGPDAERQEGPHAHFARLDPAERFALVVDLGIDAVVVYRFDGVRGTLARQGQTKLRPGSGPRHLAFHPDGRRVYVINELASTITVFDYDAATGTLAERQTVTTLPDGFTGKSYPAEVAVHPGGRFLYASNRGHDSLAIFTVDDATGLLRPAGHQPTLGQWPRNFTIDPSGAFLLAANERSDTIAVFRIDVESGRLSAVGAPVRVPRPVCLRFAE